MERKEFFAGHIVDAAGNTFKPNGNIKPQVVSHKGYKYVNIQRENKKIRFYIHRIVALSFIPNPHNYPVINHMNSNKLDNTIENLEWCTIRHNVIHGYKAGRKQACGESHYQSKLTTIQAKEIFEALRMKLFPVKELAKKYDVSINTIYAIKYGIRWGRALKSA